MTIRSRPIATNVMGTVNVLEAVRAAARRRVVVNVTTDKCYENREWVWGYRENEPMGGHDPYSSSKGCAELVIAAYRAVFFPTAAYAARYGPRRQCHRRRRLVAADRLMPDTVRGLHERRQALEIRNPDAVRPWQHVLEPWAATSRWRSACGDDGERLTPEAGIRSRRRRANAGAQVG